MEGNAPVIVDYARHETRRAKPPRHSPLAGWAWVILVVETLYRGTVAAVAHHRSPTYPWARFRANVGDPELFIRVDWLLLTAGVMVAMLAMLHPHRKRWVAALALAAHLLVLVTKYDVGLSLIRR